MVEVATQGARVQFQDEIENTRLRPSSLWGAVLAGAVIAIGIQFIFTVLGLAIGISTTSGSAAPEAVSPIGVAAGAWWLITGTISLAVGGVVLGAMWEGTPGRQLIVHAATLWGVVAIFGFLVIWSGAGIASNAASPLAVREPDWSSRTDRPTLEERSVAAKQVKDAAQTAAWWSVVGLLAGLTATVVGAVTAGPSTLRYRHRLSSTGRTVPAH
jgi:hypothetical protein